MTNEFGSINQKWINKYVFIYKHPKTSQILVGDMTFNTKLVKYKKKNVYFSKLR